ncbi:hypothetical protein KFE19_07760 [Dysosmobacter sp. Marseille-Q4140]|nr:hypothetical protein KFE19_07760 [Dysosmobacter sp. Marseille-Q4140]
MKKWCLFLCVYACPCLLAACAADGAPTLEETPAEETAESTVVCRVISELEGGSLILAEQGRDAGLYTLSLADKAVTLDGADFDPAAPGAYQALPGESLAGTTVTVTFSSGIQESWPMGFSGVTALDFSTEDFDDTCRLYLDVLEDLWNADGALNENLTELALDLTTTGLTGSEREAVAYAFGAAHGLMAMEATFEELVDQGYVGATPLPASGSGEEAEAPEHFFYEWEDGCLFSITEGDEPVIFNEAAMGPQTGDEVHYEGIRFNAGKWRTSLAAYIFSNCTAVRTAGGAWGDYTVEAEMVA